MRYLTPDLWLQPIRAEDYHLHLELMERIYPPAFAYLWPDAGAWYVDRTHNQTALQRDLATPNAPYYHVYFRGGLVGIFRLKLAAPNPDFPGRSALKLDRVYLDDAIRGQGVGTQLMEYAKAETRRLGREILWLERMDTNEATKAFYRKCGFRQGSDFRLTFERMHEEYRGMHRLWWERE
ncbi:MAG: GNAT family N-acetyltransferase [Bacteroidota bacterium]